MSADLIHSARLVRDQAFQDLVAAAMVEHALSLTTDPLSKAMVLDPSNLLPIFLRIRDRRLVGCVKGRDSEPAGGGLT
jgi:transcription initiation factor IIE alpha subunit